MPQPNPRWCLVVPVKRLATAKSRLNSVTGRERADLALAFCLDTVEAALAAPQVIDVLAVTDDETAAVALRRMGATVIADEPDAGLNGALTHGAQVARALHPGTGLAALSADLPALRTAELGRALDAGAEQPRSFVRDSGGDGTTALLVTGRSPLAPQFGPQSARRHVADGAVDLSSYDVASVRRDVDTDEDLAAAIGLGIGPSSAAILDRLGLLSAGACGHHG